MEILGSYNTYTQPPIHPPTETTPTPITCVPADGKRIPHLCTVSLLHAAKHSFTVIKTIHNLNYRMHGLEALPSATMFLTSTLPSMVWFVYLRFNGPRHFQHK